MSAPHKIVKTSDNSYEFAGHTIVMTRPPGRSSRWLVTVSGPAVNASHEGHKQRDVLAREAAAGIMLAMTLAPAPPPKRVSSGYDIDMSAPGFVHHRGTPKAATTTVVHGRVVKTPARSNR